MTLYYYMKKILTLLLFVTLCANCCKAQQIYAEPMIGYQLDLNNSGKFKQFNTGLQCSFTKGKGYEFILQVQRSWPGSTVSADSSFTANPSFPLYAAAKKTILPSAFSFALGHRFAVAGRKTDNIFFLLFYTGLTSQHIAVSYDYDKNNYTVLNPDQTQHRTNLYIAGGAEYMHLFNKGRIFFQVTASSPPYGKSAYPSSFHFMGPLAFNAGYSLSLKKN